MEIFYIIGWIFIFLGAFLILSGSLGILRFPDLFSRLHPAGITDSMGAPLVLLGLICHEGFTIISLKIAVLIILILVTSPTACHALAKAAYHEKDKPKEKK